MYRVIGGKVNADVSQLRGLRRFFCNVTAPEVSASNSYMHSNGNKVENQSANGIQQYDIAIVGGGMVGMALACSLASSALTKKLSVAIIDDNPALTSGGWISKEEPPDPRVSTITPASISFLKNIGAWKYVEKQRHAYFDKMQVWDYTGLGYTRYNARDANKEVLGCVVENKVLQRSLSLCIQEKDFQKTVLPSRLASMALQSSMSSTEMDSQLAKLELADGSNVVAKLVVGADGGRSRVRELAGFSSSGRKYPQNAIICTVEHSLPNYCAWQRFLPAGPIALLPVGENFSNIVWTMSPKETSECKAMSEDDFVKAVNHALDNGFGPHPQSNSSIDKIFSSFKSDSVSLNESFEVPPKAVKLASERMVFPLSLVHTDTYAKSRVVLIGDAAHTVHPLAGQGVNLGFGDASVLSKVISDGTAVGIDIGQLSLLRKYEAERKPANFMMATILDGVQKAYSFDLGPFNAVRAAAFHGAQYISPLKKNIILYASGEQRLPFFSWN
ncbi:hypothetical protein SOVF_142080 [Spinacia oleracea]|uniref:Ubiquinone biosynthesis monooxygenase COQ6, mitochondrial n=1 Tax=Spinacia oleracea TaxID=3562 RepID=A0A9R0JGS3_SPIOL|nr:uncharacterized protein LOC110774757 [Spinacia oleracea]KNA10684.1 hypothetical protein SOVF_142080 [Spinacia oleracea]